MKLAKAMSMALACAMAATMCATSAFAATSGSTKVNATVTPSYTLTVPESITLTNAKGGERHLHRYDSRQRERRHRRRPVRDRYFHCTYHEVLWLQERHRHLYRHPEKELEPYRNFWHWHDR